MKESGISRLIRVGDPSAYIDKKGKEWYTFECHFEDGSSIHTRRPTEEIELLPGDNVHYSTKLKTVYGNHGTAVKVADDLVMDNREESITNEQIMAKLDDMWEDLHKGHVELLSEHEDLKIRMLAMEKAIHFIGKKVHES